MNGACTGIPAVGTAGPLTITCADFGGAIGFIAAGGYATVSVTAQVVTATQGALPNVTASYVDNDSGPIPSATVSHNVIASANAPADLVSNKLAYTCGTGLINVPTCTLAPGTVLAGGTSLAGPLAMGTGEILYALYANNSGPNTAGGVVFLDNVPAGVEYVPGSLNLAGGLPIGVGAAGWSCDGDPNTPAIDPPTPGKQLLCRAPGDSLPPSIGNVFAISYKVRVPASATQNSIVGNSAVLISTIFPGGPTPDQNASNNVSQAVQTQVLTQTDLGITKVSGNPTPVAGGAAFAYTLTVTNNGPSDAKDVVVTDPLPPGILLANNNIAVVNTLGAGLGCTGPANGTNGTVTCTSSNMPAGSSATVTIVVQAAADLAGGVRTNTATVSSGTPEVNPNVTPNTASAQVTIANDASLSITKTGPATVAAGDIFTYQIAVTNSGSSSAVNAVVTDTLPANTTFLSVTGTGAFANGCTHNGAVPGTLTCTAGFVPTGTSNINVTVKLAPGAPAGNLQNTASLAAAVGTIVTPGGASTTTANVVHRADLQITKSDSPNAVLPGGDINYTITVKNNGPSDADLNEVQVTDPTFVPAGTTLKPATVITSTGFTCATAVTFPCTNTLSRIPAGASMTIKYTVVVDANFNNGQPGGAVQNTAIVNAIAPLGEPLNAGGNNQSTVLTPVGPNADLQLTKTAETALGALFNSPVRAGGPFVGPIATAPGAIDYVLTYRNSGPGTAVNVLISDVLPANTLPVAVNAVANVGAAPACVFAPNPGGGNQLNCTAATLNVGDNGTITIRVNVPANVAKGTVIKNQAQIHSDTPDANTASNTTVTTQNVVDTAADLNITKTDAPDPVVAGQNVTYTLTVTNNATPDSGSDAANVVVTDTLPAAVNFVSVASNNPNFVCNHSGGTVTCTAAVLPVGGQAQITIVGQVLANTPAGNINNTANVSSVTNDPNPADNTATAGTTVNTLANFAISKQGQTPTTVVAGENVTYTIKVTNNGPSDAQGVVITDEWAALSHQYISVVGSGILANNCNGSNAAPYIVTCTPTGGVFPVGTTETIEITYKVNPDAPSGQVNTARVVSTTPGNAVAPGLTTTFNTQVRRRTDVAVTKEDSPDAVNAGNEVTYTIRIVNNGASTVATGELTVTDPAPLPADASVVAGSLDVSSAPDFNTLTLAGLAAGAANTSPITPGEINIIRYRVLVNPAFLNGVPVNQLPKNLVNVVTLSGAATTACPGPAAAPGDPAVCDPNASNNSATKNTPVGPTADLQLTKTAAPASVLAGGTSNPLPGAGGTGDITYTITYRNNGPADAANMQITDTIPANTVFVGYDVTAATGPPAVTCAPGAPVAGSQFTCTAAGGTLPVGASGTIRYRVRLLANIAQNTVITNGATITSVGPNATPDPNTSNNTQNATSTLVNTQADLSIVKAQQFNTPGPGGAVQIAGNNITYTLAVNNAGPSDAQNVVVTDTLNANLVYVSATSNDPGFACTNTNNTVTCQKATLAAGSSATITIVALVKANTPANTAIANTGTISSGITDPNNANNTSTVTTNIGTQADVQIVKTDNPDPVVAGTNLTYTISVHNNGPSDAQTVQVVDTLPPNTQVTILSATGTGVFSSSNACAINNATNVVTCNANPAPGPNQGVLAAGASSNITIVVKVLPNVPPNALPQNPDDPAGLLNTAVVTWLDSNGAAGPAVAATNTQTSTQRTTVRHESDMAIKKEAPDYVIAGNRMDYRLTFANRGPSDVLGDAGLPGSIVVWDLLPVGTALANTPNNPFIAPGGPGNFACRAVTGQGPANNQTLILCYNAADAAGNFQAGANLEIIIKVDTDSKLPNNTNLYNCAQVTLRYTNPTPEFDPIGGGSHDNTNPATGIPGQVTPPPVVAGKLTNASGNNESCDATVVQTSADLAASKSALPVVDPDGAGPLAPVALPIVAPNVPAGSVNAGGYIRYDVPFGNNGPSDALNVMITDQIAGNTAFVGALATGGVFTPGAQPPASPFTFTIQATDTVAPIGPNVNLTCTVWQNPGTQSIYCRPQGNTGLGAPGPYADGILPAGYNGTLTYFVKVNESTASGTIISNPANITSGLCPNAAPPAFPPSACESTSDPNTANNTTLATQTLAISSSNLTVSKIVQSAVTAASNPNQTGPIGPATTPNGAGLTGTAVLPGTYLTYRITMTNNGPSDVSNIRLTDVLPSGLETPPGRVLGVKYVSVTPVVPSGATFTCAAPTGVSPSNNPQGNGGTLACTAPLLSANAPNNTAAIDVTVFIDPSTRANLVDVATFDATINNFNRPVSGSTTLTTPVAPTAEVALTKTHTPVVAPFAADGSGPLGAVGGPVTAGSKGNIYTITATNNGPSTAHTFKLDDTLPAFQKVTKIEVGRLDPNGNFVTPNAKDGNNNPNVSCTANPVLGTPGNTTSVTCTASELPPNKNPDNTVNPAGTIVIRLTFDQDQLTPQPGVPYQNCVTSTSTSTDPNPANNTNICDAITVIFNSPLTQTKTDSPDPIVAGNNLTYVITGTPDGPSAALNLTIEDALPVGTVFVSAVASPGATLTTPAVNANGTVKAIWNAAGGTPGGLTPVGTVRTLTIVVRVCSDYQQIKGLADSGMCVPNLTNNANIYSDTPPNLAANPKVATATTTVQSLSNLGITKAADKPNYYPSSPSANSLVTYTLTVSNGSLPVSTNAPNGNSSTANGVTVTDVLPRGFTYVANSVTITAGAGGGNVANPNATVTTDATGQQTVVIDLGVVGTTVANGGSDQCGLNPRAAVVVITLKARVPDKHPNITVTNQATVTSTNCLAETGTLAVQANPLSGFPAIITPGTGLLANNRAFVDSIIGPPPTDPGPGSVPGYVATAEVSDQKAGSILFYPIYTSDAANPNTQNTRLSLTNISTVEQVAVHLYVVDGSSCSVLDAFICLTPSQTTTFLASDFDPGATGYIMAVAVDKNTGLPMAYNCLIGDEYVKFTTGHAANLGAEAIAAVNMFPAGTSTTSTTATLKFDGFSYNALPRILAVDSIGSRADQNDTLFIVNAVGGNFTRSASTIGSLFGFLYDDAEVGLSFTQNVSTCQYRTTLSNNFPRLFNSFTNVIPAGRTGWMKFWTPTTDTALFGAVINRNPNAAANSGAFNQGHNLHKLTLTTATTITVPVTTPACL